MDKDNGKIQPAKDTCRKLACEFIKVKYNRSIDWAYKVARKDTTVQDGIHFRDAYSDYINKYEQLKKLFTKLSD